jgi:hypothetical protein
MVTNHEPPPCDELRLFGEHFGEHFGVHFAPRGALPQGALRTATNKCSLKVLPRSAPPKCSLLVFGWTRFLLREHLGSTFFLFIYIEKKGNNTNPVSD